MNHAQALACNILNMSKSDFEELMTPVEVSRLKGSHKDEYEDKRTREAQNDQNWKKNVEKIAIENVSLGKNNLFIKNLYKKNASVNAKTSVTCHEDHQSVRKLNYI